jgi:hypothetical protein
MTTRSKYPILQAVVVGEDFISVLLRADCLALQVAGCLLCQRPLAVVIY